MLPLSFKEFLDFYEFAPNITVDEKFQRYLQFGGMPILREYKFNEARSNQALEGIYSTVVLRDILHKGAHEHQQSCGQQGGHDKGHDHLEEAGNARAAEVLSRLDEGVVDILQCTLGVEEHQREQLERHDQHDAAEAVDFRDAQILGNNQPNITRYINLLEHELGCSLCVRTHKGISLTPEGQLLYEHVEAAMYQLKNAQDALKKKQSLESGTITIGVSDTALRLYLSDRLENFLSLYPNVRIKLTNNFTSQAITALENGFVDFCIITTPFSIDKTFTQNTLYSFEEILICQPFREYT